MITQLTVIGEVVISTKRKKDLKDFIYLQLLSEKDSIYPYTRLHYMKFLPMVKSIKKKCSTS